MGAEPGPGVRIGVDDWVAEAAARTQVRAGPLGQLRGAVDRVGPGWRLAVLVAAVAAVPVLGGSQLVIRIGINALLFALLALGLNVIVGEAGLLDLGYIAFYGFGAYGYALLSSNQFHLHWPSELTILLVTVATAGLARAARGRDRRRAERHPGAPAEAVRVRGRRRHRRPVRHRLRRRPARRVPAEFRPDPADHDLRGGGARRRGEPAGRAAGRGRDQRAARGPPQSRQRAPAVLRCAAGAPARAGAAVVAAAGAARRDGGPRDRDPAGGQGAVAARGHRRRRRLGRARQGARRLGGGADPPGGDRQRRLRGTGRRGTGAHASAERRSCIGAAPGITCGDIGR